MEGVTYMRVGGDGAGTGQEPPPERIEPPASGLVWVRVDLAQPAARDWLAGSGLDRFVVAALTAPETRPRCTLHGDGVLLNLRGVNLNPGDEIEDMVSLRLWITERVVVSAQFKRLMAISDAAEAALRGQGPSSTAELVARLALRLADRAEPVVAELNGRVDLLEEKVVEDVPVQSRGELGDIRRASILLRRHMAPQRDALSTFQIEDLGWIGPHERARLREATERMTRLAEELDAIRDRAQVVHDQVMDARAEALNRQMLILSAVAAIFLPLGLITGLLGTNIGGIPGAENRWAFWIVTAGLVAVGLVQVWLFRRLNLLRGR